MQVRDAQGWLPAAAFPCRAAESPLAASPGPGAPCALAPRPWLLHPLCWAGASSPRGAVPTALLRPLGFGIMCPFKSPVTINRHLQTDPTGQRCVFMFQWCLYVPAACVCALLGEPTPAERAAPWENHIPQEKRERGRAAGFALSWPMQRQQDRRAAACSARRELGVCAGPDVSKAASQTAPEPPAAPQPSRSSPSGQGTSVFRLRGLPRDLARRSAQWLLHTHLPAAARAGSVSEAAKSRVPSGTGLVSSQRREGGSCREQPGRAFSSRLSCRLAWCCGGAHPFHAVGR